MKKYVKRPLVIEAARWDGEKLGGLHPGPLLGKHPLLEGANWHFGHAPGDGDLYEIVIETLEGEMTAEIGDWIIRGIKNEVYPCKPDIFDATYEEVEERSTEELEKSRIDREAWEKENGDKLFDVPIRETIS